MIPHTTEQPPALEPLISEKAAPYPINALPPIAREAAKAIAKHAQVPIELSAPVVLSALTNIAQGRINAPSDDSLEGQPCSLFFLTLAESGSGKSRCRRLAFKPMDDKEKAAYKQYQIEQEEYQHNCKTLKGEKLEEHLANTSEPADPTTSINDATYESIIGRLIKSSLVINWDTDEGGIVLCGQSMTGDNRKAVLGGLTKAFDDGSVDRTRSRGNAEGSGRAYNRRLSMMITTQEFVVRNALEDPVNREQGLLPRFLLSDAPSLAGTRFKTVERKQPQDYKGISDYWAKCQDLLNTPIKADQVENEIKPDVMPLDDDALYIHVEYHNTVEEELGRLGDYEGVKHFGSRSPQLALRLAVVLAYFEGKQVVDSQSMLNGCTLAKYSLDQWAGYGINDKKRQVELDAVALFDWLTDAKRGDGWSCFDMARLSKDSRNGVKTSARLKPAVAYLTKKQYLIYDDDKQYTINPRALDSAGNAGNAGNRVTTGLPEPMESREQAGTQTCNHSSGSIRHDNRESKPDIQGFPAVPALPATLGGRGNTLDQKQNEIDEGFEECI